MLNLRVSNVNEILDWYVENVKLEYARFKWPGTKKTLWELVDDWTWLHLQIRFEDLLRADFQILSRVKNTFDQASNLVLPDYIADIQNTYDCFSAKNIGIGGEDKKDRISAVHLIQKMGSIACPYCNKTQIENRINIRKRTCELDHFYNQSVYKFMALSFFNLVPSCESCNGIKQQDSLNASPYDARDISNLSSFDWAGDFKDKNSLQIIFTPIGDMIGNNTILDISGSYSNNVDDLQNILIKLNTYPKSSISGMMEEYNDLYTSKERAIEVLFNTVLDANHHYKKVLSKFTVDIIGDHYD